MDFGFSGWGSESKKGKWQHAWQAWQAWQLYIGNQQK